MFRKLIEIFICVLILLPGSVQAQENVNAPALEDLITEALENNPDLEAARERWIMNSFQVPQAESLDDPMLTLGLNNYPVTSLEGNKTPMTGRVIQLSQKFPFPGKLAARGDIAEQRALWDKAVYEDQKLQLIQRVKEAFYRIYYLDRAVGITGMNIELLDDFIRLAETRYEVGQGLQQDVLKAHVERSRMMDRQIKFQQQRIAAAARLNTLLNRPTGTEIPSLPEIEVVKVGFSMEELQEVSQEQRPLYNAYRSLVERFRAEEKLARLNYYPDINVGAGYTIRRENMVDDGEDFVGLQFSVNLPVYRQRREAAVAQAESGVRMALRQYDNFRNEVFFRIHDSYSELEKNYNLLRLFKSGIIPQASQSYESSVSAYQVGRVDFLTLVDALIKLYQDNIEFYRLVSAHEQNIARLEAESGLNLKENTPTVNR